MRLPVHGTYPHGKTRKAQTPCTLFQGGGFLGGVRSGVEGIGGFGGGFRRG